MSAPRNVRAVDQEGLGGKRNDFVDRKYGPTIKQIYTLLLSALMSIGGIAFIVYKDTMIGAGFCIVMGTVMLFVAREIQNYQRVTHAAEFLNALFASVLSAGHKFCCVAKDDGEIVYLDRAFQDMFPDIVSKPKRTVGMWLATYNVGDDDRGKLLQAVSAGAKASADIAMETGADRARQNITVSIDPIARPAGFVMLRGR